MGNRPQPREVLMAIRVLITRRFKKGNIVKVIDLLKRIRSKALNQPGYITGETLYGVDDPDKLVVIATWESQEDWERWKNDPQRKAIDDELEELLLEPTSYEVFGHLAKFLAEKS